MLAAALEKLPADKRDIILLSYFMEMTDREIARELDTVHQNVSKRRVRILKLMRIWKRRVLSGIKCGKLTAVGYHCRNGR